MDTDQYNEIEIQKFRAECLEVSNSPLQDRREGKEKLLDHISNNHSHFDDSVNWLVQGCYGHGAYLEARKVFNNNRMNKKAWLFTTVANREYRIDSSMACRVWNSLSTPTKNNINALLNDVIDNVINDND